MVSLNERTYEYLKELIAQNKLSYQKIYSETKLAREMGISRTPFRDAIHRLAQEGYLDIIPSKGFQLHQMNRKDVDETFQVRSALESYCTVEITKHADSREARALFAELDAIMGKMKHVLDTTQSIEEFCNYDFQFHVKVINYLHNEQFSSIFAAFMYRMRRLAEQSLAHKGRMQDTYDEHFAILEGMRNGDIEHIYEITLRHMNTPRGINLEAL